MKKVTIIASALAFLGAATMGAHAQELRYNPSVYVTGEGSFFNPDNQFGTKSTGGGGGLKVGKAINQYFDVQAGVTYDRAKDTFGVREQSATAGLEVLYFPTRDTFRPFFGIGAGAENNRRNIPNQQLSRTAPYASARAGVQYQISDQWATEVDYRRVFAFQRSDAFPPDRRTQNGTVNVGLTYYFGKTPTAPERVAQASPPPPPPAPLPPPPPPAPRFEKQTFASTEMFGFDSATLRPQQSKLDQIVDVLKNNPDVTNVQITGYTDRIGKPAYNQRLSQRRAEAVKAYLVRQGIDASRLQTAGKGEADPVVQCTDKNRAALIKCLEPNRRVEIEDITVQRRVQ